MKQIFLAIFLIGCSILSFSQEEYFYNENPHEFSLDKKQKTNKLIETADKSVEDYCIPEGMNCNDGDGLQGFALSNIDNLNSGCSDNGYGDFTNLNIQLAQGNNYTIQAFSGYSTNYLSIWIDFNNNDVFDGDELLIEGAELGVNEITEIPLSIPLNAATGEHRLRATVVYQNTNPDPCEVYNYGECEDYTVTIISPDYKDAAVISIAMEDAIPVGQVTPKAEVGHLGLQTGSFEVTMTDGQAYSSTKTVTGLDFGETEIIEFDTYNAATGTYTFEACTDFSGDVNPDNDCLSKEIIIESFDAGVTSINIGATAPAGEIVPSVKVSNFTTVGGSGEVELIIGSYSSTKSFSSLDPNGFVWVEMDPWNATVGDHTLEGCFISGDANPDNDCIEQPLTILEPEVRFNANETVVLTGLDLRFFDKSDFDVSSYQWSFEGGTPSTSTDASPQVSYNTNGIFDVELTITHAGGTETLLREDYISVSDEIQASFEIINNVDEFPIYQVFFVNENLGFGRMGSDNPGKYSKTTDGGDSWEIITVPGINKNITSIHFTDELNGFFRTSQYGSPTQVYSTSDGGNNWEFYAAGLHSQEFRLDAYDKDHLIICGQQSIYETDMSVTSSGPDGWTHLLSPEADAWSQYQGVQWLSPDSIFAMRFMDANYSYDGGATWENKSIHEFFNGGWENFGLNAVKFPNDENVGFACGTHYNEGGGIILKSTDNGQTWDECCRGFDEGRNIHFYDENIGLATGYNGFVYKTSDGGETWYGTNLSEPNMHEPFVVNENLMFVCVQGKCYRSKNGFFQQPINKDATVHELNMSNSIILENAPFSINFAVKNVGKQSFDNFAISYQIDDGDIISQQFTPNYSTPNNVIVIDSFDQKWTPVAGEYDVKVWLEAVDGELDENQSNDTLIHHVLVTGDQWDNRKVILEEATGTWCGYCVNGILTVEALSEAFNTDKTRFIPVAIHGNDQWEIERGSEILDTYSGGAYPSGWVDRTLFFSEQSVRLDIAKWGQYTEEQINTNAPMNVDIDVAFNVETRLLEINTEASFYANIESQTHFNCYILEDNLKANQANNYNSVQGHPYYGMGNPIPDFNHKHVLREILEDAWGVPGDLPSSVSSGDSYDYTFHYSIPEEYNLENLSVVCFVSKHNEDITQRDILNANVVYYDDFTPVGTNFKDNIEAKLIVFPNPARETLRVKWVDIETKDYSIELINYTGQSVYFNEYKSESLINEQDLNVSHLSSGAYYIKLTTDKYTLTKQIIIQ